MPLSQSDRVKLMSPPARAETINGASWFSSQPPPRLGSGRMLPIESRPLASVWPYASSLPSQALEMRTAAPATGTASASEVTQTSELSRPHLKCTAMSVTKAPVAT